MRQFLRSIFAPLRRDRSEIERINAMRTELSRLNDTELHAAALRAKDLLPLMAVTAVIAARVLGQDMFDVQLRGALALTRGSIAEMQTGEGKTLAAVPAVAWYARQGQGVHVMTVNYYLARRDAAWMATRWSAISTRWRTTPSTWAPTMSRLRTRESGRWKTRSVAAISTRSAICGFSPRCRRRCTRMRCCAATWTTW